MEIRIREIRKSEYAATEHLVRETFWNLHKVPDSASKPPP